MAGHRAGHRADMPEESAPAIGKRKAASRRSARRAAHARFFPSIPTLIGAGALVVAAAGAVTIGSGSVETAVASGPITRLAGQANGLNGVSDIYSSNPDSARALTASRSASRAVASADELQQLAQSKAENRDAALAQLNDQADSYAAYVAKNAWFIPITPGTFRVTGYFGECTALWRRCHSGLDLAAPTGTPITAIAHGTIMEARYDGNCGNRVIERIDDGTELWYCHQSRFGTKVGTVVDPGDPIGFVGSTGHTTGPHLHIEVHPGAGDAVDPLAALRAHGVDPTKLAISAEPEPKH